MSNFEDLGIQIPKILLPINNIDPSKWAVIACDQFTSQPEYWQDVETIVGNSPSTLRMILPEVFLETEEEDQLIDRTKKTMDEYLDNGYFQLFEGFILVERKVAGKTRFGLMVALDLEKYDFSKGSQTLIRATEGTIIDRLPPRIRIREGAKIEFPHILVLIDDPNKTVIEPLIDNRDNLKKLYDFDLMKGSGQLTGYAVNQPDDYQSIIVSLSKLSDPENFKNRYGVDDRYGVLLYAMGDGNHSLATAKSIWEKLKPKVGLDHPSRYALVEIENIHDAGLEFEPIHRVLFSLNSDIRSAMQDFWESNILIKKVKDPEQMINEVDQHRGDSHKFGFIMNNSFNVIEIKKPATTLPAGSLQSFLDQFMKTGGSKKIDYVHGSDITCTLGSETGNCGFYLPAMQKDQLFKTVILDGSLPRKTFSMGEAYEKRFYFEGRKISS